MPAEAHPQSYYNLSSVCAGESQGGNPIGKALEYSKTGIIFQIVNCADFASLISKLKKKSNSQAPN